MKKFVKFERDHVRHYKGSVAIFRFPISESVDDKLLSANLMLILLRSRRGLALGSDVHLGSY